MLRRNFYYEKEQLDVLVGLMKGWRLHLHRQVMVVRLMECVHWSMEVLDEVSESHRVLVRRKKVVRRRKERKVQLNGEKQSVPIAQLEEAVPATIIKAKGKRVRRKKGEQPTVASAKQPSPTTEGSGGDDVRDEQEDEDQDGSGLGDSREDDAEEQQQAEEAAAKETAADVDGDVAEEKKTAVTEAQAPQHEEAVDTQAATLELFESPKARDAVDTQAPTLELPDSASPPPPASSSIDTAAPTLIDQHPQAASLDTTAPTQLMDTHAFDTQADTQALNSPIADSSTPLDELATQLLPPEAMDEGDPIDTQQPTQLIPDSLRHEEPEDSAVTTEHSAAPAAARPIDASSSPSSLATLVSEMDIHATEVVMDSLEGAVAEEEPYVAETAPASPAAADAQPHPFQSIEDLLAEDSGKGEELAPTLQADDAPIDVPSSSSPLPVASQAPIDAPPTSPAPSSARDGSPTPITEGDEGVAEADSPESTEGTKGGEIQEGGGADGVGVDVCDDEYEDVEVEEEVEEVTEDGYVRRESAFNFSSYLLSFCHPLILSHYLHLLSSYATNPPSVNSMIIAFLSRVAFDQQLLPLLFQLSFLHLADRILQDPSTRQERLREVRSFVKKVVRGFFDWCEKEEGGRVMWAEVLFWKSLQQLDRIKSGYKGSGREELTADVDKEEEQADEAEWAAEAQAGGEAEDDWRPSGFSEGRGPQAKKDRKQKKSGEEEDETEKPKGKKPRGKRAAGKQAVEEQQEEGDGRDEIDITALMGEHEKKERDRLKREKREEKRKEAEAKEREKERQRRALLAQSDDDEEELQLGEYRPDAPLPQPRTDAAAVSNVTSDDGWTVEDEAMLRAEFPKFASLQSRYLLMTTMVRADRSEEEMQLKVQRMGLHDPAWTAADADLHLQTTDEDDSEHDHSKLSITDPASPLPRPSLPSAAPPLPSTSRVRARNGHAVDVKRVTADVYDAVAALTLRPAFHPFIHRLLLTLQSCASSRTDDALTFTLDPLTWDELSGIDDAPRRVRKVMAALSFIEMGRGGWAVQRQYSKDKVEAVAAVVERAFENVKEDLRDGLAEVLKSDDEEEEEEEERSAQPAASDAQMEGEEEEGEEEPTPAVAAAAEEQRHARVVAEVFASQRETRKRKEAPADAAHPPTQVIRAEDELDNPELAQFLRDRRSRGVLPMSQLTPQAQPSKQIVEVQAGGLGGHRRLRKVGEGDVEEVESGEGSEEADRTEVVSGAPLELVSAPKRRRVLVEDAEDDVMQYH